MGGDDLISLMYNFCSSFNLICLQIVTSLAQYLTLIYIRSIYRCWFSNIGNIIMKFYTNT